MDLDYEKIRKERNEDNYFCKANGIFITELKKGHCVVETDIDETKINPIGTVHGGLLFTMADTCAGAAASTYGHWVTTVTGDINYLRAGKNTKHLRAESREVKVGKTLIVNDVDIYDENRTHLAHGTYTFMVLNHTI